MVGADEGDVLNMVVELSKLACFTTFGIEQLYNNLNIMFDKKKKIVRTNKKGPGYVGNLKCLGNNTGAGKPAVFWSQVTRVRVRSAILQPVAIPYPFERCHGCSRFFK